MRTDDSDVLPAPVTAVLLLLLALLGGTASVASAATRVKPAAVLSLSPASGPSGTATTATGSGFPARTRGTLTVSGATLSVTTDRQGRFTASAAVSGTPGPQALAATVGGVSASASFDVVAPARLAFGVSTPGGPQAAAELDSVAALAGEEPTIVLSFTDMTRDLDVAGLHAVAARGATPLLTWEPWAAGQGRDQPEYSLDRVAAGDHDARLRAWALDLAAYGGPVMLRFAHEMNGDWYPWAEGVNGNGAGDYVAAWRHVHAVVTAAGATNVEWVWAPNVPYRGSTPLDGLFPGADVLDLVALDGYNWGTSQTWSTWQSPAQLLDAGLSELRRLAPGLPVMVTETAGAEQGGDKAQWIRELVAHLAAQPDVRAFVWFHHAKEADWRIDSSAAAATAFREALAARG